MTKELVISQKELDVIQEDLETNKPYEACGIIIGVINDNGTIVNVEKIIPVTNIRRTRISFELDPQQFYDAWNESEKIGREIVGIYHTHPASSGIPSSWDRETMENFPSVWLIAGVDGIRGYVWNGGIKNVKILIKE